MRLLILCIPLFLQLSVWADSPAGTAAQSSNDKSCIDPAGKMAEACHDLAEALEDPCVQKYFNQFQQKAESGQIEDASKFCSNPSTTHDQAALKSTVQNFCAGIVAHESNGNPTAQNSSAPNGTAKGLFQTDAASVQGYECCKGVTDSQLLTSKINAKCGVGMTLQNMDKDNVWAEGHAGSSEGCARFNEVCRDSKPQDKKSKEEISSCTLEACQSPQKVQDSGSGSAVSLLFKSLRATPHLICEN